MFFSLSLSLSSDLNNYHSNILNTAENHPNLNHYNLFQNISKIFKIVENHHCSTFSTSQSPEKNTQALRHRGRIRIDDLGGVPAHGRTSLGGDEIDRDEWREYTLWLCQNSYWKWPFVVDLPIENGDFP